MHDPRCNQDDDPAPPIRDPVTDAANEEHHQRGLNEDGGIARMYEEEENEAEPPKPRLIGMLEGLRPIASAPDGMPTFMVMDVVMQRSKVHLLTLDASVEPRCTMLHLDEPC